MISSNNIRPTYRLTFLGPANNDFTNALPISGQTGNVAGLLYEADMEAEEQRRELAHLSRVASLGELSGALAHELNQPLAAILANGGFMPADPAALESLGKSTGAAYSNSSVVASPALAPLTDIFASSADVPSE